MGLVLQHSRGLASALASDNSKIEQGQLRYELDTLRFKFGDGGLWNATDYVGTSPKHTSTDAITADAGQAQGGSPITTDLARITTVGTAGDSVTLRAAVVGEVQVVVNDAAANKARVFPASGDDLGAGSNTKMTIDLAAGEMATFFCFVANIWRGTVGRRIT